MIESTTLPKPILSKPVANEILPKQSEMQDFERILRQLRKPDNEQNEDGGNLGHLLMQPQSSASEKAALTGIEELGVKLAADQNAVMGETKSEFNGIQLNTSLGDGAFIEEQDYRAFDALLETPVAHWLQPSGVGSNAPLLNSSSVMTLQEFSSLLEQGWQPSTLSGDKIWRFSLQGSALPLAQIVLTGSHAAGRSWSLGLTINGKDKSVLSPHLQQLRTRLERLGSNVGQIALSRENVT